MAVQTIAGIQGSVTLPSGANLRAASWSVETVQEVNDCSGFTNQPDRENLAGMKSWSGSAAGYLVYNDASATPGKNVGGSITFTAVTGCTITGTVRSTRQTYGTGIDGNAIGAMEYVGTGALSLTWDESST